jgi:hypothetical protein
MLVGRIDHAVEEIGELTTRDRAFVGLTTDERPFVYLQYIARGDELADEAGGFTAVFDTKELLWQHLWDECEGGGDGLLLHLLHQMGAIKPAWVAETQKVIGKV